MFRPQITKIDLGGVAVLYHSAICILEQKFQSGGLPLRVGVRLVWRWQPSLPRLPASCAHLEPSTWQKNQRKAGDGFPVGSHSGVAYWEGVMSTAASVGQAGAGQGKPSQAKLESRSQGTTTSQLPQMLD